MPIVVECPSCNRKLRVPDELLGQQVKCPTCGATFAASTEGAAPPPEPPPLEQRPDDEHLTPSGRPRRPAPPEDDRGREDEYDDEPRRRRPMRRDMQSHRGVLILVLGIISIISSPIPLCCGLFGIPFSVISVALGLTAWIMGQGDLAKMNRHAMDPEGRGLTQGGWICGIIGTVLGGLGLLCLVLALVIWGTVGLAGGFAK
jgi:predicted Zn finger-like uncharacterized protein